MKPVKVTKLDKAFKGAARSYEVDITNGKDPLMQVHVPNMSVESTLKQLLTELKKYKVYATIKVTLNKQKDNGTIIKSTYCNSKPQIITDKTNIYKTLGLKYHSNC